MYVRAIRKKQRQGIIVAMVSCLLLYGIKFALCELGRPPVWRHWGQSLRTQEKGQALTYRGVLSGKGKAVIDGEEISLAAGDWLKISPMAKRQFFAASNSEITYICVQVKENSLEGYTATDAVIY